MFEREIFKAKRDGFVIENPPKNFQKFEFYEVFFVITVMLERKQMMTKMNEQQEKQRKHLELNTN